MLSIFTQFLSNRSQHVMVDSCRSKLVNVVLRLPQGSVLGPLLFLLLLTLYCTPVILGPLLYTLELFSILENKLIGYADDATLIAVVPSPGVRVTVAESLSRGLVKVSDWCDLCRIKFNASKSKMMIPRFGILKSWKVFHDRLLLGRCFRGFVMQVLEYGSSVW